MASIRLVASLALVTACYRQDPDVYQTLPEPTEVSGPPGGEIDPAWQQGYLDENPAGAITAPVEASADPNAPGFAMGATTDAEIDQTLDGYGEWIYIEGYGEVWRPYTTSVGVNFTPYETCGSWVWTDWGWTFACEWEWGWLPFHYGQWGWFDDYWAWVPGYEWTPAAVEWRGGGGYVGWRPQTPILHDHRGEHTGLVLHDHRSGAPIVRDHRAGSLAKAKSKDWQWRFAAIEDFGKPRIRSHLFKSPAEGLRVTSLVARPPVRATVQPVKAESIMRARLAASSRLGYSGVRGDLSRADRPRVAPSRVEPARGVQAGRVTSWQRPRATAAAADDAVVVQPGYRPPMREPARAPSSGAGQPRGPEQTFGGLPVTPTTPTPEPIDHPRGPIVTAPTQPAVEPPTSRPPRAPISTATPPTYTAPPRPSYEPPAYHPPRAPTYTAPTTPTRAPERPGYTPPVYAPPSQPTYTPPSQPTYTPPSRAPERPSYSPPTYSPPTYSPSRSSSPSYSPPTYSPSRSSSPSYSPPPTYSPPAAPSGGGMRSHRR